MATLNAKTLAAVTLAAVTLTTPAIAQANNFTNNNYRYEDCKRADGENQLVGGLLGAVAGGVFGSQVAGRGARTEGSALGAVLGAGLGAAIGDDQRKCNTERGRNVTYQAPPQTYSAPQAYTGRSSARTVYQSPRIQTVRHRQGYDNRGYGYTDPRVKRLNRIDRKIDTLRYERAELKKRLSYRYDPYLEQCLDDISYKLKDLKTKRKRIKKALKRHDYHYDSHNSHYSYR